ncbi:MAG: hypothetical protein ACR2PS_18950 [Pseudomonadales bacterium]
MSDAPSELSTSSLCVKDQYNVAMAEDDAIPVGDDMASQPDTYRIGRMVLDGADHEYIRCRLGVPGDQVEAAWSYCQQAVSTALAATANRDYRLMSQGELQEEMLPCRRLLLTWEESAKQRLAVPPEPGSSTLSDGLPAEAD